jgi:hypothetical protein
MIRAHQIFTGKFERPQRSGAVYIPFLGSGRRCSTAPNGGRAGVAGVHGRWYSAFAPPHPLYSWNDVGAGAKLASPAASSRVIFE